MTAPRRRGPRAQRWRTTRGRARAALRTTTGATLIGLRRRAAADGWPLVLMTVVLLLAVLLADATPRLLTRVADQTARAAVVAQPSAGLTVSAPLDRGIVAADRDPDTADEIASDAATIAAALPAALAHVLAAPSAVVSTTYLPTATPDGPAYLQMAYLWRDGFAGVDWLEGRAPGASAGAGLDGPDAGPWPVQVGLSAPVAALLGAHPGDRLAVSGPDSRPLDVTVTGVYQARDPSDPLWADVPGLLEPVVRGAHAGRTTVVGALLSSSSVPDIRLALDPQAVNRTFTLAMRPDAVRYADLGVAARAASALEAAPATLGLFGPRPTVWTQLDALARTVQARVRAAGAQASVLLVGTLGASAAVLVLAAWLLVRRRAVVLRRHRARGASLAAVGLGLAAEQVMLALVVGAIGLTVSRLLVPGPTSWAWVLPVLALAALGVPALGTVTAAGPRAGRTASDGHRRRSRQVPQVRRAASELALVLAATAALVTLRRRGLPGEPRGADLLLVAAPALCALAVGVVGSRATVLLQRAAVLVTARLRRAGPMLASAGGAAGGDGAAPFVALTLCTALAAFSTVVGATLAAGQVTGSWDTVGADVVVHTDADHPLDALADPVAGAPGVGDVALGRLAQNVQLFGVPGTEWVDVLAVDADQYARLLAATPLAAEPGLSALGTGSGTGSSLPVLSSSVLSASGSAPALLWNGRTIPFEQVGAAPALTPTLAGISPRASLVVVDRQMLAAAGGAAVDADVLWAVGPGAEQAVDRMGLDASAVTGRTAWLAERRDEPLTAGLILLLRVAAPVLAALGLVVVVLAAAAGAPRRAQTLAVLRVLGLNRRQVGWVATGEVLPWVLLATASGLATGAWLAALALGPLQLRLVTGQGSDPALVWPWWLLVLLPLLGLAAGAVAAVQAERRSPLGQVMRIGG